MTSTISQFLGQALIEAGFKPTLVLNVASKHQERWPRQEWQLERPEEQLRRRQQPQRRPEEPEGSGETRVVAASQHVSRPPQECCQIKNRLDFISIFRSLKTPNNICCSYLLILN